MKRLLLILITTVMLGFASFSQVVCPPSIPAFTFTISKPVIANQKVGVVSYCEPDVGQIDTWSIIETQTLWKIDQAGNIMVADATAVNTSALTTFAFTVKITDNGFPILSNSATITLTDANSPPVINAQLFTITENSIFGTTVGTIVASDSNNGQSLTYTLVSGNTNNTFALNPATGILKVATNITLDFEKTPTYALVVKVIDNGTGTLSSQATITVNVTNVNEAPVIIN